jgi:hypothetical protein
MRELLFFPENLASPLQWASYSQDGKLTLQDAVLPNAWKGVDRLAKKGIALIISGQQVASYRFAMPKVTGNARDQAIAFALEGICSQPLDEIYVIGGEYINGKQSALVIQKAYLDGVLAFAKEHNLKITSIRIDYMLLAKPEPQCWTVAQVNGDVLWRTDTDTGGRVEAALWPFILEQVEQEEHLAKKIVWQQAKGDPKPLPLPDKLKDYVKQEIVDVPSWIDQQAIDSTPNHQLNIGQNRFRALFNRRKQAMGRAIKILVAAIVIAILAQVSYTVFVRVRFHQVNKMVQSWLKPAGFANIPLDQVKQRLESAIAGGEKMQADNGFLLTLSAVSQALSAVQFKAISQATYTVKNGLALKMPQKQVSSVLATLQQHMPSYTVRVAGSKVPHKGHQLKASPVAAQATIIIQRTAS